MDSAMSGVVTSLVTPFISRSECGGRVETEIDEFAFNALLRWQARAGVRCIAVAGWIGEASTLTRTERIGLVEIARAVAGDRMTVLAHVGSNATKRSITFATDAQAAGADGLVLGLPYYNKPNLGGIVSHVLQVARVCRRPLFLEIDSRTGLSLRPEAVARLLRIEGVAGMIDHSAGSANVEHAATAGRRAPVLAAHEPTAVAGAAFGAHGIFSALANVMPHEMLAMWAACARGDFGFARRRRTRLLPLLEAIEEDGVAALKTALQPILGIEPTVRLPLVASDQAGRTRIRQALELAQCATDPVAPMEYVQ